VEPQALIEFATAIRKVRSMSIRETGALAEEIHRRQPHMLASCLVQSKLDVEPTGVNFRMNKASKT
jgi:hypothetical protein